MKYLAMERTPNTQNGQEDSPLKHIQEEKY